MVNHAASMQETTETNPQQECIPVGRVPIALYITGGGGLCKGRVSVQGKSVSGGVSVR